MFKKFYQYLSQPKQLSILNAILIIGCFAANRFYQVFCIPSQWARVILIICALTIILIPLLKKEYWGLSFIEAINFCIFVYCIIFLAWMNIWGVFLLFFFGLGLLVYVPHFFMGQVIRRNLIKPKKPIMKKSFGVGILFCISIIIFSNIKYHNTLNNIEQYNKNKKTPINKNFFSEKILGMHFIYHTRFCEYDGWRPPIHEPLLIINMWLSSIKDPLDMSLKDRIALYKKVFPNKPVKFNCSCAIIESSAYHNDSLWK